LHAAPRRSPACSAEAWQDDRRAAAGGAERRLAGRPQTQQPITRIPGLAIMFNESVFAAPPLLKTLVARWGCLHETVVMVHVRRVRARWPQRRHVQAHAGGPAMHVHAHGARATGMVCRVLTPACMPPAFGMPLRTSASSLQACTPACVVGRPRQRSQFRGGAVRAAAGARAVPAVPTGTLTLATAAVRAPAQVAVPTVLPQERMLFSRAGLPGIYRAVLRFGYLDRVDLGPDFVAAVVHEARGPAARARAPAPFQAPPGRGAAAAALPHAGSVPELY